MIVVVWYNVVSVPVCTFVAAAVRKAELALTSTKMVVVSTTCVATQNYVLVRCFTSIARRIRNYKIHVEDLISAICKKERFSNIISCWYMVLI